MPKLKYDKTMKILKHLVLNGETAQPEIPKIAACSYRTALREIRKLENAGLIRHVRNRREKARGPPQNVWKLTFRGILQAINLGISNLENIISLHKNECIIFSEWDYISKHNVDGYRPDIYLHGAASKHMGGRIINLLDEPKLDVGEYTERTYRIIDDFARAQFCASFLNIEGMISGVPLDSTVGEAFAYFMMNPSLKRFVSFRFDTEEQKHEIMLSLMEKFDIPRYSD